MTQYELNPGKRGTPQEIYQILTLLWQHVGSPSRLSFFLGSITSRCSAKEPAVDQTRESGGNQTYLFSGNLEIAEISYAIWHFYPVLIGPSSFSRDKLEDFGETLE